MWSIPTTVILYRCIHPQHTNTSHKPTIPVSYRRLFALAASTQYDIVQRVYIHNIECANVCTRYSYIAIKCNSGVRFSHKLQAIHLRKHIAAKPNVAFIPICIHAVQYISIILRYLHKVLL